MWVSVANLKIQSYKFVLAVKYRLGLPVFNTEGPCPACLRPSDTLGDQRKQGWGKEVVAGGEREGETRTWWIQSDRERPDLQRFVFIPKTHQAY